ncbi:MAG: hypothetical protein KF715_19705 [Candidatus Didemnitutus sp.]|nr:hypothetical protein [Candidatus Didemnitutus sp.]
MKPHDQAPEGVFCEGLILYGAPERGATAAKGFLVEPMDVRGGSFARLNALQDQLRSLLASIVPPRRLQVQWWPEGNYAGELAAYHAATAEVTDPAVRQARNERTARYAERMRQHGLRRERLALFLTIEITRYGGNWRTARGLREHYAGILRELQTQYEEFADLLRTIFHGEAVVDPMGDEEHCGCLRDFLNPSLAGRKRPACEPGLTVQEQCWLSDGIGQPDGGFVLDGQFHAMLTLARWPQRTRPGIVTHLTGLPFLDYRLTVNLTPVSARGEVKREERAIERLSGEYSQQRRHSLLVALRKKERKVENLSGGFAHPFLVTYVVRVWAATRDELRQKLSSVQAAITAMDGAQYYESGLPASAKKLFFATWPGWTQSSYCHRELYAEDAYLADLLPFSATFVGDLKTAEALYDGSHLNLVGVSPHAQRTPQHALVFGMSGAGKSEFIDDLFLQTAGFFGHTLIVDIGGSHRALTERLGGKALVVHPDGGFTLNYLDTQGVPLTQLHLATVVALLARMVGVPDNPEILALRQAQLSCYVHQLYHDTFVAWERRQPERAREVRRIACATPRWWSRMPEGTTAVEAFLDLRERQAAHDPSALELLAGVAEEEITRFGQEAATARLVAQTACAYYSAEDFPTHGSLVDLLAFARLPEHDRGEIERLATLLRGWCADGQYGRLFDGTTTVSLNAPVVHFELGMIPEQAVQLKAAVGLLISGISRQHIISLPSLVRKRALFEEVGQFLDIPGGEAIVSESYAQLRKHNCWAVSVVQQYARFRTSRVKSAVIGNAKQYFLLRQADRQDMKDLAEDVGLPETAVEAIQRYPLPEQQPKGARFSSVCYFSPTAQPPRCGTLRHVQAPEVKP